MVRHLLLGVVAFLLATFAGAGRAEARYAHSWTWKQAPSSDAIARCAAEMRRIVETKRAGLLLEAEEAGIETVFFNGTAAEAGEPFVFPGDTGTSARGHAQADASIDGFNDCRTERKPYDAVVTACLLVARDHFAPDVLAIDSDGTFEAWQPGAMLYEEVTKRKARSPLTGAAVTDAPSSPAAPTITATTATFPPTSAAPTTLKDDAMTASAVSRRQWLFVLVAAAVGILVLMVVPTRS